MVDMSIKRIGVGAERTKGRNGPAFARDRGRFVGKGACFDSGLRMRPTRSPKPFCMGRPDGIYRRSLSTSPDRSVTAFAPAGDQGGRIAHDAPAGMAMSTTTAGHCPCPTAMPPSP